MRIHTTTAAILSACVALGLGVATAAPATAASDKKTTGSVTNSEGAATSVRATTKDVKIKKGKFTGKDWMTIYVDVPDAYIASDGSIAESRWQLFVTPTYASKVTCARGGKLPVAGGETFSGDQTLTLPALKSRGLEKKSAYTYLYHGAGRCKYEITVSVTRPGDPALGIAYYSDTVKLQNVTYDNQAPSKSSISSATKVKKNKSFKVSGKATFSSPKDRFKTVSVKKGAKVEIQFRKNGKGAWKTIKSTKVARSGAWSAKVKLKSKGSIRAVVRATTTSQDAVTKTRTVKVSK